MAEVTSLGFVFVFHQYHLDYRWDAVSASATWRVTQKEPLCLSSVGPESVLCSLGSAHSGVRSNPAPDHRGLIMVFRARHSPSFSELTWVQVPCCREALQLEESPTLTKAFPTPASAEPRPLPLLETSTADMLLRVVLLSLSPLVSPEIKKAKDVRRAAPYILCGVANHHEFNNLQHTLVTSRQEPGCLDPLHRVFPEAASGDRSVKPASDVRVSWARSSFQIHSGC